MGHEDVLTGDFEIQMCFVLTAAGPELDPHCPTFHTHPEALGEIWTVLQNLCLLMLENPGMAQAV